MEADANGRSEAIPLCKFCDGEVLSAFHFARYLGEAFRRIESGFDRALPATQWGSLLRSTD